MSLASAVGGLWAPPKRKRKASSRSRKKSKGLVSRLVGAGRSALSTGYDIGTGIVGGAASLGYQGARAGLEGVVKAVPTAGRAVVEGLRAANPIEDVKKVYAAGKNLVSNKVDWKEYKAGAKKGKFLGKGNLATTLFYGGAVATGIYPALLGLRFGLGASGYAGKEVLTNDYVADKVSRFVDKRMYLKKGAEKVLGIKNGALQKGLTRRKIRNKIKKLENDDFYRKNVQPYIIDGAIGIKGYGSLIGTKWIAGMAEKGAEKLKKNTSSKRLTGLAAKVAAGAGFVSNFAGDYISLSLGSHGIQDVVHDVSLDDVKAVPGKVANAYHYTVDGELMADVKDKYQDVKGAVNTGVAFATSGMWKDMYHYAKSGDLFDDITDTGKKGWAFANGVKDSVTDGVKDGWDKGKYVFSGDAFNDIKSYFGDGKFVPDIVGFGNDMVASAGNLVMRGVYDAADVVGINESEQYAVLISGYDRHHRSFFDFNPYPTNDMFTSEMIRAHNQITEMGIPQENIIVMTPDGTYSMDPSGRFYPSGASDLRHAMESQDFSNKGSEANLKDALALMADKVDGNDTFCLYLTAHGLSDYNDNSEVGLQNGSETLYDHELAEYCKNINGGRELYFIGACQSGGFADKLGKGNDIAVSTSDQGQNSIGDLYGQMVGPYFFKRLKERGGLQDCTPGDVRACLIEGTKDFKEEHSGPSRYAYEIRNQNPQYGHNGNVGGIRNAA